MKQLENQAIPEPWRGYLASTTPEKESASKLTEAETKFPNFSGTAKEASYKLEDAELGDIVIMPYGPKNDKSKPGLAKLAMVIETHLKKDTKPGDTDCETTKSCYVKVMEPDNGKWPDICGTTDTWGEMKTRYYFKPGHLPPEATKEYERIKANKNCEETRLSHCEMNPWDSLKLYRIRKDERTGCDKAKAIECDDSK
jgi:hypothetical protein